MGKDSATIAIDKEIKTTHRSSKKKTSMKTFIMK